MYKFNRFLKILFLSFQSRILEDASIMCNSWSPRHNVSITLTIILPSSFSHPNRIQHARTILVPVKKNWLARSCHTGGAIKMARGRKKVWKNEGKGSITPVVGFIRNTLP